MYFKVKLSNFTKLLKTRYSKHFSRSLMQGQRNRQTPFPPQHQIFLLKQLQVFHFSHFHQFHHQHHRHHHLCHFCQKCHHRHHHHHQHHFHHHHQNPCIFF